MSYKFKAIGFKPMDIPEQMMFVGSVRMLLNFLSRDLADLGSIEDEDDDIRRIAGYKMVIRNIEDRLKAFEKENEKHLGKPMGASLEHEDDFGGNPLTLI